MSTPLRILALSLVCISFQGCVLTKVVTVPMRVVGAVVSIIPLAGNTAHDGIDAGADAVDDLPF